ncbi:MULTISPECIES: thioredoxin domain-containing protein [unclassified Thioalkalivibrio]|uniref:thioredoxin domain-containing protein n=1 Tax=unclassified Thioalkalivibrio TaxID=2621013 RepID=UPI0003666B16
MFATPGNRWNVTFASLLLLALAAPVPAQANPEMADSISPYLRLHVDDPVQWRAWDPALLEKAKEEQRPLLISSGYYSCYYCHVMQEKSFKDDGIAERLNENFIPVKVDREVNGALDSYLLEFQRATAGSAGWPLNIVVTPNGHALTGVVYAPRDQFAEFLDGITERLEADYDRLVDLARRGSDELTQRLRAGEEPLSDSRAGRLPQVLWNHLERESDDLQGGFGSSTKFPHSPYLRAMLEAEKAGTAPGWVGEFLEITLDEMAHSGLRDVLGGGFFRYSESPDWNEPHFEVMLEDQAQLALVYLRAGDHFGRQDWIELGLENLDFVKRDMALREDESGDQADTAEDGFRGFASSLSAVDAEGREGGAYLWPEADIASALADHEHPELVRARFGMEGSSVFDLGYLPRRGAGVEALAERFDLDEATVREQVAAGREALIRAREARGLPRDEKVLTGAHGLLLSALAEGAQHDERFREAGAAVQAWLLEVAADPEELPALMGLPSDQAGTATLNDYAFVARGLRDWKAATGEGEQAPALALLEAAWERFRDDDGFRSEPEPPLPGMISQRFHPAVHRPSPTTLLFRLSEEWRGASEMVDAAFAEYDLRPGRAIESDPEHHARLILWLQERNR